MVLLIYQLLAELLITLMHGQKMVTNRYSATSQDVENLTPGTYNVTSY